jgi:predicted Rossmann fold nucleotide-binding protein DprA/Smf involved in DNA uptake
MPALNAGEKTCYIVSARTARATHVRLTSIAAPFPSFVHKWTKLARPYAASDLLLPRNLYLCGREPDWQRRVIAIGGTRSPTAGTFCLTANVVRHLASAGNIMILSGGVPGVDAAAHLASLDVKGASTYAVMANPARMGLSGHEWHSEFVSRAIRERGGFLSEYTAECELWTEEHRERLLARDRIISGLCDLMVVFECNSDSATVDTARRALLQGKKVVCVEAMQASGRRGTEQLRVEFGLEVLREAKTPPAHMAARILEVLEPVA